MRCIILKPDLRKTFYYNHLLFKCNLLHQYIVLFSMLFASKQAHFIIHAYIQIRHADITQLPQKS